MIVQTLKRSGLIASALLLTASTVWAAFPSARTGARMAFDESKEVAVLFGGTTLVDLGTAKQYELDETWLWDGERWMQHFPAHHPAGRDSHSMTYDSTRQRVVLFGGKSESTELADTWFYQNGDWTEVETPNAPSKRVLAGMAFDPLRDRVVIYGGTTISADGATITQLHDMWEFDGTTWTQIFDNGPAVNKPLLVFDEARSQLLMLGFDDNFATQMYAYDPSAQTWNRLEPETLPPCVNESGLTYQRNEEKVFLVGGVCSVEGNQSSTTEEVYTWDGSNWTKPEVATSLFRVSNPAIAFDSVRNAVVMYGGTTAFSSPRPSTYRFMEGDWKLFEDTSSPGPRSLFGIATDHANKVTWLIGGLTDLDFWTDFWKYQEGVWEKITAENAPQCATPVAAFDADRSRLVVVCPDSSTFEWDGSAWKSFSDLKTKPRARRFSSMVYDQSMKKTVLFGGFDEQGEYTGRTWLWDGTSWTELKKKKPHSRALTAMWYDPIVRKTVIFGGLGRRDRDAKIERYTDMWTLDSNGWKELKPSAMPTTRYGAQAAVDPRTNHTILFGGLRLDTDEKGIKRQVYADDTWEWDGTTWRKLATETSAAPRENGAMFFDPSTSRLLLLAGWSGFFRSDLWSFEDGTWRPAL